MLSKRQVGAISRRRIRSGDAARSRGRRRPLRRRALPPGRPRRRHDPAREAALDASTRVPSTGSRRVSSAGSVLVSATNGKTTTTAMVAEILGGRLAYNRSGANLLSGVASTLLSSRGAELGLFEVDEAALPEVARRVRPRVVALGNLFRDQLDRYGELEHVAERWRAPVADLPETLLVVNADDPLLGELARGRERRRPTGSTTRGTRARRCSTPPTRRSACVCGAPYLYAAAYVGHLGDYRCPNGHAARLPSTSPPARSSCTGSRAASSRSSAPGGERAPRARAARALQRLQRDRGDRDLAARSAPRRRRSRAAWSASRPPSAASSGSRSATGAADAPDQEPRRGERGGPDASRRCSPTPRGRRAQRRDRRRPGRLVDLGRRLRAAARRPRARGRHRRPRRRARAALRLRRPRPRPDRGRPVARGRRSTAGSSSTPPARSSWCCRPTRRCSRCAACSPSAATSPSSGSGGREDPRRPPLPELPQHLRRPRQHRRARAHGRRRAATSSRSSRSSLGDPTPRRHRPLLRRRRPGPRAGARRARPRRARRGAARGGRGRRCVPRRLRRLPAARPRPTATCAASSCPAPGCCRCTPSPASAG